VVGSPIDHILLMGERTEGRNPNAYGARVWGGGFAGTRRAWRECRLPDRTQI